MESPQKKITTFQIIRILWIAALIFVCVWAMRLSPVWTGQVREHRNQYEVMAESLLNGHLYMDIEPDSRLLEMDNPYDPEARKALGVDFKFDHAFYKGRYYMYFGVVPVIILFLPFRILAGRALSAYHATQIFTALIIIGFFFLTDFLRKRFFPKMSEFICTLFTTALVLASIWYFADAPALYCTAISSAVCMMVWSLFFYFSAVFSNETYNKRIITAIFGALFGALAFGCRPPVALANILVLPLFHVFVKSNRMNRRKWLKLIPVLLPYLTIGLLLMAYNYARFENPFEFGQTYQLTNWDQQSYSILNGIGPIKQLNGFVKMFLHTAELGNEFPYVRHGGILFEYPLFTIILGLLIFSKAVRERLRNHDLLSFLYASAFILFLITIIETAMSPHIEERYHFDINYLIAIGAFLIFGNFFAKDAETSIRKTILILIILSLITIITSCLLFFVPYDFNFTAYDPKILEHIRTFTPVIK